MVFKFLPSKVTVGYRARVFRPDTIHLRNYKSDSTVVAKFSLMQLKFVALNIKCNHCSMKVDSGYIYSYSSHASEGGVAPSSSLKLLAGCLHIGFCSHLSTKN